MSRLDFLFILTCMHDVDCHSHCICEENNEACSFCKKVVGAQKHCFTETIMEMSNMKKWRKMCCEYLKSPLQSCLLVSFVHLNGLHYPKHCFRVAFVYNQIQSISAPSQHSWWAVTPRLSGRCGICPSTVEMINYLRLKAESFSVRPNVT